ncbi:MAG: CsgG/HfaB family protein [Myxococcota bacterium]|jgi:TolB-like protein
MTSMILLATLAVAEKPSISVMYFDNNTNAPELNVLRKGLAEMMVTDLIAWDGVTVVERDRLETVLGELKLQSTKAFDQSTTVKVGKLVGAKYAVAGGFSLSGNKLRVTARIIDVERNQGVGQAGIVVTDDKDKIFDIEQQLVDKLIAVIDAKLVPDESKRRRAKVPSLDALVAYSAAIDLSDQGKLKEAQAAMQALVSRSPTFLLARERRDELLARFQEYELKKKDLISGAALELGRVIDDGLRAEGKLDSMSQADAQRHLALRMLKGRYLLRVLKQHLSTHGGHVRVVRRGHEGEALLGMRAWLENQRRLDDELARIQKRFPWASAQLPPSEAKLAQEAKFGDVSLQEFLPSAQFVLFGMANDGDPFAVAPALGFVDPKERQRVLDEAEARIARAMEKAKKEPRAEYEVSTLIELKANAALGVGNVDGSVTELQRFLDAFPTSSSASRFESRIKDALSGRLPELQDDERWVKALKGCDGMDLIVGARHRSDYLEQFGLPGLEKMAKEMDEACGKNEKVARSIGQVYSELAREAAQHDDCALYQAFTRKSVAAGYSVRDTLLSSRRLEWCEVGPALGETAWFFSRLDRHWEVEFVDGLASSLSGGTLTLEGVNRLATPAGVRLQPIQLRFVREGDRWRCESAEYTHYDLGKLLGECSGTVKKLAEGRGGFDEGTFSATFPTSDPLRPRIELTDGEFKLKRQ